MFLRRGPAEESFMDDSLFGLKQRPFRNNLDTKAYYPASGHEQSLAQLLGAIKKEDGIALLTGEVGVGKTLLCHCLVERLGDTETCLLTNSHFADRTALLQAVLYDLSLSFNGLTEQGLRLALSDHLLARFSSGQPVVLIVDEAHHLSADVLEELRLLTNMEGPEGKALQVVLCGHVAILEKLQKPELACLAQRLATRARLEPLCLHEAADYLVHHLRLAGPNAINLFTDEALDLIARSARGIPRRLNQAASQALDLARETDMPCVDAEVALEALALVGLEVEDSPGSSDGPGTEGSQQDVPGPGLVRGEDSEFDEMPDGPSTRPFRPTRRPA
jgi:type II secretory pathway predicted ATPase ExeA